MDRIDLDDLRERMESNPFVAEFIKAFNRKDWGKVAYLSNCPSVQNYGKQLQEIEVDRLTVIANVAHVVNIPQQDAEVLITRYCRVHHLSWAEFNNLFMAGTIRLEPMG